MTFVKRLAEFRFPDPDEWYCQVLQYHRGHSELFLQAQQVNTSEILTITFIATRYFEGPLDWRGADFIQEPQENCEVLMRSLGETNLQFVLEASRLFSCRISNATDPSSSVRIVAGMSAFVTDKWLLTVPY